MLIRRQALVFDSQASSATDLAAPAVTDTNPTPSVPVATDPDPTPIPEVTSSDVPDVSTPNSLPSQTGQPGAATSTPPPPSIKLGTVIGACLGSFTVLVLVIAIVVWHNRRTRRAIRLNKHDNWNKLSDKRDSRRSSFESKPSLPPLSFEHANKYPPNHQHGIVSNHSFQEEQSEGTHFIIPSHPYSSSQAIAGAIGTSSDNPFNDPVGHSQGTDPDAHSVYSTASNPFESVYTPPKIGHTPEPPRSPFFTPHPDSHVQMEKWGSVGKERNVQESFSGNGSESKLGSLIAALDLDYKDDETEKADKSIHGHLGKFEQY